MSPIHWLLVILVALVLFGPSRFGQAGKGLGEGIRSFKKALAGDEDEQKPPQITQGKRDDDKRQDDDKRA